MVVTAGYFMFISKDWLYLSLFFCALSYIALMVAFFCPESPRWLIVNSRSAEGIVALNQMAKMNKVSKRIPEYAVFVEDPKSVQARIEGGES